MPPAATDILLPSSFFVEGYRAFRTRATVPLRPLTLLYGPNSAGKSSLLRFLVAMSEAMKKRDLGAPPFNLNGRADGGGSFDWEGASFSDLAWSGIPVFSFGTEVGSYHATWKVASALSRPALDRTGPNVGNDHRIEALGVIRDGRSAYSWRPEGHDPLAGLLPEGGMIAKTIRSALVDKVRWVQRWRGNTPRHIDRSDQRHLSYQLNISDALRSLLLDCGEPGLAFVNGFFERLEGSPQLLPDVGDAYNIPIRLQRTVATTDETRLTSLTDEGDGLSQALPGLVAAYLGSLGQRPLVCLEQPELHLHPKAQKHLADTLFTLVGSESPLRLLIETHSENLLLSVQLALIEGRLHPEDVALCWVGPDAIGRGSVVQVAHLDNTGRDSTRTFPRGVFSTDNEIAQDIIHARIMRGLR